MGSVARERRRVNMNELMAETMAEAQAKAWSEEQASPPLVQVDAIWVTQLVPTGRTQSSILAQCWYAQSRREEARQRLLTLLATVDEPAQ